MAEEVTARKALYAHLLADAGVRAAVGDRVHQRRVPQDAARPLLIVWPPISDVPQRDLDGIAYRETRLQVTAMAMTQPEAEKAARAAMAAVEGFIGTMAGTLDVIEAWVDSDHQEDQDDTNEIHHHVDVMMMYRE